MKKNIQKDELYKNYKNWRSENESNKNFLKQIFLKIYQLLILKKIIVPRIIKMLGLKNKSSAIIDLGCGSGKLLYNLHLCGYKNLIGVDIQELSDDEAQSLGFKYIKLDILEYIKKINDRTIDCVILTDVLEHLELDKGQFLISEVKRILTVNGKFLVRVPNMSSFMGLQVAFGDLTHKSFFNKSSLCQLLLLSGFEDYKFVSEPLSIYPPHRVILRFILSPIQYIYRLYLYSHGGKDFNIQQNIICIITAK